MPFPHTVRIATFIVSLAYACAGTAHAQNIASTPAPELAQRAADKPAGSESIPLTVPKGTAIQIALAKDVRVKKVGQPIHGRVVQPVYAFDKLVVPVGTDVIGQITKIEGVSAGKRTTAALDADFTPARKVGVEFNQINLAGGKQIPIQTSVTPGSGQTIEFVSAANESRKNGAKDPTAEKLSEAERQAKQEWNSAIKQVKEPGRMHRLERYAVAQLPVHPQYIDSTVVYFAELQEPLDFGSEALTPEIASSIRTEAPDGSLVEALLITALNSATAQTGDPVQAMVSRPVFDGDRLVLPQGTIMEGMVLQAHAAHRPSRNGEIRIVFREMKLANGLPQKIETSLVGVETAKGDNVRLDAEGGAKASAPKTRLLSTGAEVGLGAASFLGDSFGETGPRTAGGAGGFKLIGIAIGLTVHSQPVGMAMGGFGGVRSIYANFIAPGHDVILPKNTALAIGIEKNRSEMAAPGQPVPDHTTKQ